MEHKTLSDAARYAKRNERRRIWQKIVRMMACIVVFCTTYALILPAITLEKTTCGLEEHTHTDECYHTEICTEQTELICNYDALGVHTHTADCYDAEGSLVCGLSDYVVHSHDASCLNESGNLVCTLPVIEEHVHLDSCYQETVIEGHTHGEDCWSTERGELICQLQEVPEHEHSEDCYTQGELICGMEESEGHTHGDKCSETILICQSVEEDHTHGDGCFQVVSVCEVPESEGHQHSAECYESLLICQPEQAHQHSDSCYETVTSLICQLEEQESVTTTTLICQLAEVQLHEHTVSECYEVYLDGAGLEQRRLVCDRPVVTAHVHSESCYQLVPLPENKTLICPFTEGHLHTDSCYDETGTLICTDSEEHVHVANCYGVRTLTCTLEEHTHDLSCSVDLDADTETEEVWINSFSNAELTGHWPDDVVAVAQTQLGYKESVSNYIVLEDGKTQKGYSRYGAWYGDPYGDWCAMFASFCLHYAGVEGVPLDSNCQNWIGQLTALDLYQTRDSYVPIKGDLIFFDWGGDGVSNHVGIVAQVFTDENGSPTSLLTIEGNSGDSVCYNEYSINDSDIMGYGLLPLQEVEIVYLCGLEEHEHDESCLDELGDPVCGLTAHSHYLLCTDPNAQLYCWLDEHSHSSSCRSETGIVICDLPEHRHDDRCCDSIQALIAMIDTLPTSEEAEAFLLACEEAEDWESYAAYQQRVANLAWPLYYACEELSEEDLALVTNYDRLMDLAWLWSAVSYALPAHSPYFPMEGEWATNLSENNDYYNYVHVNEIVPDSYTVDGMVLGEKLITNTEAHFESVFSASLAGLTEEECVALTGYPWKSLDSAGLDNTYGANLIMPADKTAHDALLDSNKNFVVYYDVGTYGGNSIDLLIQIVNYKPFEDDAGVVHDGILGFYTNGYIGVAVCGVEWVKLRYNFIPHSNIETGIQLASSGASLSSVRTDIRGSTSFYDVDYAQAVHMYGTDDWKDILKGIYVTNVIDAVPDLDAVNALTGAGDKRDYFREWTPDDCVLKVGSVSNVYDNWTGPVVFSPHEYDAADEDWRADSKHAFTATFKHNWFYMNFSFDKGRNAEGGIRHFAEPVSRGRVTIQKEVTGVNVDPDKEFNFKITFYKSSSSGTHSRDTSLSGTYGDIALTEGVGTFTLKDGMSITVSNLPIRQYGTFYKIEELNHDGYVVETSVTSQAKGETPVTLGPYTQDYLEGELKADSSMTQSDAVVFENYGGAVLPETGGVGTHLYTTVGLLLMTAAALLYINIFKRRKEDAPSF